MGVLFGNRQLDNADIIAGLRPPAAGVLITYLDSAADVCELCRMLGVGVVQLHGDISRHEVQALRKRQPDLTIIKSLVVGQHPDEVLRSTIDSLAELVDAFITDTFDPVTGATGATGMTHDWSISRHIVELSEKPVILAGGLTRREFPKPRRDVERRTIVGICPLCPLVRRLL